MEVSSYLPGAPALPLGGLMPNADPVQIRDIEGLGPVKANTSSTPFATGRGELWQGSSTPKRNIVLTLGLNPNWADQSMMSLRQLLYRYFMVENWVTLRFYSDELPLVFINAIVESFEPAIFSEDPELQISVLCPKPDFIQADGIELTGDTGTETTVSYSGTVSTGFNLQVRKSSAVSSYSGDVEVTNDIGPFHQDLTVHSVDINASKTFELNTLAASRHVRSINSGGTTNILSKMDKSSTWPELSPGDNTFKVRTPGSPGLTWVLGYQTRYGGL
jgi:hypothetical protein